MNGTQLTHEEYITQRLEQYKGWYDGKAVKMKKYYQRLRSASVIGGSLVPALVNVPFQRPWGIPVMQILVTVISLTVVILVSLETVFHFREQWKNYRSTEQLLGHEKFLFQTRVGRYRNLDDDEAFRIFVERVEDAVAAENAATLNTLTTAAETSDAGRPSRARTEVRGEEGVSAAHKPL